MCRRNSYYSELEKHIERYNLVESDEFELTYHRVAGATEWPIVLHDSVRRETISIRAHWGLIPFWTKERKDGIKKSNSMVNARRETIHEKPAYSKLVRRSRCIIPSTGFYEYHHLQGGKLKVPFFVRVNELEIFSIAGIYTTWTDKQTGEVIPSFSMITTDANEIMRRIHNGGENAGRMPLILTPEMERQWIDPSVDPEPILNFHFPSEKMQVWPINTIRPTTPDDACIIEKAEVEAIDWL